MVMRALDLNQREAGPGAVRITSDYVGLIPIPSYPVDLIHLFTSGPQDAIVRWPEPGCAARRSPAREDMSPPSSRTAGRSVSFEAADIVSQVMSFGSPTPVEVAVQGSSLANDYGYAQKVRAVWRGSTSCATW